MARSSWRRVVTPAIMLMASLSLLPVLTGTSSRAASSTGAPVLLAAGDIDGCGAGDATAKIIDGIDGVLADLGDNAYPTGSASDYAKCYEPTWGRFKDRTRPVPGNHDYDTPKASGYFGYFGATAGPAGTGYYSYDLGGWHIVALNDSCGPVDCNAERTWLDEDLTAHPTPCTLAYLHHPRFSSGSAGDNPAQNIFWKVLYDHNASVVLSGHDHDYERFAPQDPNGKAAPGRGLREFIVGTGGGTLGSLYAAAPNSEVRNNQTFGVLQLTLRPDGYDWRFVPVAGSRFTDSGSDRCSAAAVAVTTTTATPSTAPAAGPAPAPPATTTTEPAAAVPTPTPSPTPTRSSPKVSTPTPVPTKPTRSARSAVAAAAPSPRSPKPARAAAPPPPSAWSPRPLPVVEPVPAPAGRADGAPEVPSAGVDDPAAISASPTEEAATLPASIARLIGTTPGSHHSGSNRRGVATVALMLMLADCVGIAALHRGRPSATLVGRWTPALATMTTAN